MKKIGRAWFPIVVILIFGLAYLTVFGLHTPEGNAIIRGVNDIRWGIDVRGGISVTFGPAEGMEHSVSPAEMDKTAEIMAKRLEEYGVSGHQIYTDTTNMRLIVSIPQTSEDMQVTEDIVTYISAPAQICMLEGRIGSRSIAVRYDDEYGRPVALDSGGIKHRVSLDSEEIASARTGRDENGNIAVLLTFTERGEQLFLESTGRLTAYAGYSSERYISVCMDDRGVSEMYVDGVMSEGIISLPEGMTQREADTLVSYINHGALPFELQIMDYELIDATLGNGSIKVMLAAGTIAFAVICLFMIVRYRLPGAVAGVALLGQVAGILAAVSGFFPMFDSFTLTLPGVAGIILSIGMGVDANIITGERIAEEMRKGKTIEGALEAGNDNSLSSIFDGNVTVMIVSVILMGIFGPPDTLWSYIFKPVTWMLPVSTVNSIYAFGYTLFAGVIFNFIMGVAASRIMLRSLSCYPALSSRKLYGGGER